MITLDKKTIGGMLEETVKRLSRPPTEYEKGFTAGYKCALEDLYRKMGLKQ